MTETVEASLSIELNVTCPECEHYFDLVSDTNLNEEGWLFKQTLPDDRWNIAAGDRLECVAYCPHCSVEIDIKGVAW
jgi:rubredoxin